jgi:hypothetical protein
MSDAQPVAATGPSADAVASAMEIATTIAERPDDAPSEVAPAAPEPPSDAPDVIELPSLGDITKTAEERAAARAQAEQQLAPVRELLAPLQQQVEQLRAVPNLLEQLRSDPAAALKAAGHDLAKVREQLQPEEPDPVSALERIIEEKLAPILERVAPKPAAAAPKAPPVEDAKAVFAEYVAGAATDFPNLAALPPAYVGAAALDYVQRAHMAGHNTAAWTDQQIARAVEREIASGRTPSTNGATPQAQPPGATQAANGGTTTSTRSISNGLAADGSRLPPQTDKDRFNDAVAFVESLSI